jgi:hypothetical protein
MKAVFLRGCTLLLAASLGACATGSGGDEARGGADVTTSHLGQQIARGQIAIEAFDAADANMPEFGSYAASVARQLTRLGWTVVNTTGQSEQVALVDVQQGSRAGLSARINMGTAMAGAANASGSIATLLEVRIRRRSDGTVMWEGSAISDAPGSGAAAGRSAAVDSLAAALFRDFPGASGRTIRVR